MRHFYCTLRSHRLRPPPPAPLLDLEQVTSPGLNVVKHELRELLVQVYLLFAGTASKAAARRPKNMNRQARQGRRQPGRAGRHA